MIVASIEYTTPLLVDGREPEDIEGDASVVIHESDSGQTIRMPVEDFVTVMNAVASELMGDEEPEEPVVESVGVPLDAAKGEPRRVFAAKVPAE